MVSRPTARRAELPLLRWIAWGLILAGALGAVLVAAVGLWPPDHGRAGPGADSPLGWRRDHRIAVVSLGALDRRRGRLPRRLDYPLRATTDAGVGK
jgi:hypothetical protein